MRVRLASFFTGAAAASFLGLYTLHKDYKVPHQSFTQQRSRTSPTSNCLQLPDVPPNYVNSVSDLLAYIRRQSLNTYPFSISLNTSLSNKALAMYSSHTKSKEIVSLTCQPEPRP
ncbi:hypothetical protein JHK85_010449 [Glycine max]|nr:hypothetical protein JHK85_010449 [Glycine max]